MNAGEARQALLEALQSAVKADGTQMRVMGARTGLNPSDLSKAKLGKLQSITLDKLIVMCAAFGIGVRFEIVPIEVDGVVPDSKETNSWIFGGDI